MNQKSTDSSVSRRQFLQTSAAVSAAAMLGSGKLFAAGDEKIKVALVGCGGRGYGAMTDSFQADPATELVAMADLFEDRLQDTYTKLKEQYPDRIKVTPETMFVGFDAYQN